MDSLTATYFVLFVAGGGFAVLSWLLGVHGHHGGHGAGAHGGHGHVGGGAHGAHVGGGHGAHVGGGHGAHVGGAHGAHVGGAHAGGAATAGGAHSAGAAAGGARGGASSASRGGGAVGSAARFLLVPFVNLSALAALACVGGGAGYLARRSGLTALDSVVIAAPAGLAAAYAIGGLMAWLQRGTRYSEAFNFAGTVATVLSRIAPGATGEVVFTRDGARRALAAVATDGRAIDAGTEVIVVEVERGIARVTPSHEVFGEERKS